MQPETMMIDDVKYVREDSIKKEVIDTDGLKAVLIRTYSAGVHFGYLRERTGKEGTLINTRRIYSWQGACSLSQISQNGVDVKNSKISIAIPENTFTEITEIMPLSSEAFKNLMGAPEWKK
jgi:hypothetical protein